MYTISKEFRFCAAHRIISHAGRCAKLHGHGYIATVQFAAAGLNHNGMVVDFGDVKSIIGRWIDLNWDHNAVLNRRDVDLINVLTGLGQAPTVMDCEPTAENLAKALFDKCKEFADHCGGFEVVAVHIDETETCSATYSGE
jgi:6-pyruvoyltetrahydropterin/6-carboxytetrahydropterin synthase